MNKYQKFVVERIRGYLATEMDFNSNKPLIEFLDENNNLLITQDENYNIKHRNLLLASTSISYVEIDGKRIDKINDDNCKLKNSVIIPFDFDKKSSKVTIHFMDDIVEPIDLGIRYIEVDHSIYDAKVQKEVNSRINPEHKTGNDLVNIYWDLVSERVSETRVILYSVSDGKERLIAKYKENEAAFKSITGLAFGNYKYEIIEFDEEGKELARTPKISFTIKAASSSGKPTIII